MDTFRLQWRISITPPKHRIPVLRWKDAPGSIVFDFWFAINGTREIVPPGYALSFTELYRSLCADGRFYIYTCICGDPGCVGVSGVDIVQVEGKTLWIGMGVGSWLLWRMGFERLKQFSISEVVPLTRANTADLPTPESLVRASQEPVQAQKAVLLRAASDTQETQAEQLLRAGTGKE